VMVYGEFGFCSADLIAKPARCWRWQRLGEGDFSPGGAWIGNWPRVKFGSIALILAKGVPGGIRRDLGVAA
jgi:hypothetical protein